MEWAINPEAERKRPTRAEGQTRIDDSISGLRPPAMTTWGEIRFQLREARRFATLTTVESLQQSDHCAYAGPGHGRPLGDAAVGGVVGHGCSILAR